MFRSHLNQRRTPTLSLFTLTNFSEEWFLHGIMLDWCRSNGHVRPCNAESRFRDEARNRNYSIGGRTGGNEIMAAWRASGLGLLRRHDRRWDRFHSARLGCCNLVATAPAQARDGYARFGAMVRHYIGMSPHRFCTEDCNLVLC